MKIFLKFICFIPFLIFVLSVNVNIDPALLFSTGEVEKEIAQELIKGNNISSIYNYDERKVQINFINNITATPDILAVGSSRVMQIRNYFFEDSYFINSGLSGATIEDIYGIIALYEQNDKLPKKIILGLDPWILNQNNEEIRWLPLKSYYTELAQKLGIDANATISKNDVKGYTEKMKEALSFKYFQESVKMSSQNKNNSYYEVSLDSINEIADTKLADGSRLYNAKQFFRENEEVEKVSQAYIEQDEIRFLNDFDEISKKNEKLVLKLIEYLKLKNIEVTLILHPYHPIVWDYFAKEQKYGNVLEAEKIFITIAKTTNTELLGSYNPNKINMKTPDFYDAYHLRPTAMKRLLE
ncbi:hypothetical protein ACE193_21840 [Bernardetia sp. OM2101]|uniref:hypothetical protein n=1 Tax=Bernardetia sp. OM2101 TaxID=3344876 RepID=UPI0035CF3874